MGSPTRRGKRTSWRIQLDESTVLEATTKRAGFGRVRRTKSLLSGVAALAIVTVAFAAGAAADGTGTIGATLADYAPGDSVTLAGSAWTAGETVHVVVDDDQSDPWTYEADLTADVDGVVGDSFPLPSVAGTYAVAATATSGSASASFTVTAPTPVDPPPADPPPTETTPTPAPPAVTVPYLVRFAAGASTDAQAAILASAGAESTSYVKPLRIHGVLLPGGDSLQAAIDALRADPAVTNVEPDRERTAEATPDDSGYGDQWALPKIGWDNVYGSVTPSGSAKVAILDTGVDASHPDLDGVVDAGTSILDGSDGLSDPNGHGTEMAGIVAAETGNGDGIAGVGFAGVTIMPVTVLGADGTGQDSDVIEGVVYAAEHGADVILMAFSNPGYSAMLQAAVDYAWSNGAVLVAATGNDGATTPHFPAGDAGVIGVSATDSADGVWSASNTGDDVFLAAPGVGVQTTSAGSGYGSVTGTSAAAAHVAGAAALLKADSGASNGVIVGRLARTAEAVGTSATAGNGRLQLDRAIADTGTDPVKPAGAAPVGGGGPFVGPYVVATTATVSGTVTSSAGGAAIAGATVTISCPATPPGVTCSTESTTTSGAGFYSLSPNWAGPASRAGVVTVSAVGFVAQSKPWGPLSGGGAQTVNFSLVPSTQPTTTSLARTTGTNPSIYGSAVTFTAALLPCPVLTA